MTNSQQGNDSKTKKVRCWPARIVGIIGLFFILMVYGNSVQEFPKEPLMIPLVIFWSVMIIGGVFDCIRVGREGMGGLIILLSGIASYLYLLLGLIIGWWGEGGKPMLILSLPLFGSGILFYMCGRRRRNLKE